MKMNLSVFLLLALLGLSSASRQDRRQELMNQVPEPTSSLMFGDNVNLEWLSWDGSVPNGAVEIYNDYTERTDYVCKFNCEAGFYNPFLGSYCNFPYGDNEFQASTFEILTNKDNFEFLEWKKGSYGSVPQNAVKTCTGGDIYVGKNKYGLGKVVPQFEAFFLPWKGSEHWYKSYEVLAINREAYTQTIDDVKYGIDEAAIFQSPPEAMHSSQVINNDCQEMRKTVSMKKTTELEKTWNIGRSTMFGVTTSITTNIPLIASVGIQLSAETTQQFSKGTSVLESIAHEVSLTLTVKPNESCKVLLEGRKKTSDIPYTARLSRTYRNGKIHLTSITGRYKAVQIGEVRAVLQRCEPVAGAKPCP